MSALLLRMAASRNGKWSAAYWVICWKVWKPSICGRAASTRFSPGTGFDRAPVA
jgi:hypothetical protein